MDENLSNENFEVVRNNEGQYSIWLSSKQIPAGWNAVGKNGDKDECLAFIREVWTDMAPLSLRNSG